MKTNRKLHVMITLAAVCAMLSAFAPMPGAHNFQVYLDDKLVADQYASSKTIAPKIVVDPAENHKQLIVKYNECGRTVTAREITFKETEDKVLKEVKFDGTAKGLDNPMSCGLKDIVALKPKNGNAVKVYYASADFPEGQHVVTLVIGPGTSTASN
jgi:hypothetical protein